jgi:hypothetical protein
MTEIKGLMADRNRLKRKTRDFRFKRSDRAFSEVMVYFHIDRARDSGFEDGTQALITADKNLNKGENVSVIRDVFVRRGILPNPQRQGKRAGASFDEIR